MGSLTTIKRGSQRYYIDPDTGEYLPGVTSVIGMEPKDFLKFWSAKLVAEWCADNVGAFTQLLVNGQREAAIDTAKKAPTRSTAGAADIGTMVHDYFELYARGEAPKRVHPDIADFVPHIAEFHDRYQPEYLHLEDTVVSTTHKYAGSFDFLARINGETVMGDLKTTRSGVYESVALQLAAYAHADKIVTQDGEHLDLPHIDAGACLHVRPEGWKLVPARIDAATFEAFLALRRTFDWQTGGKNGALGAPDYDSTAKKSTGSQRRASK